MTRVNVTVCPNDTEGLTLDFEMRMSALGVTASVSVDEQTPPVHDTDGLLLVKPTGGVSVATFLTEVWA